VLIIEETKTYTDLLFHFYLWNQVYEEWYQLYEGKCLSIRFQFFHFIVLFLLLSWLSFTFYLLYFITSPVTPLSRGKGFSDLKKPTPDIFSPYMISDMSAIVNFMILILIFMTYFILILYYATEIAIITLFFFYFQCYYWHDIVFNLLFYYSQC